MEDRIPANNLLHSVKNIDEIKSRLGDNRPPCTTNEGSSPSDGSNSLNTLGPNKELVNMNAYASQIKDFDGTGHRKIEFWLTTFDGYRDLNRIPEANRPMVVGHHLLRGPLEYWEEALALNKEITWDALKKDLVNKYKLQGKLHRL